MLSLSLVAFIASGTLLVVLLAFYKRKPTDKYQGCTLPPGPRGWPVIGSLLDLPHGEAPWTSYRKWAQVYGDIIFFRVMGTPMLLLSSAEAALDLMEKRSAIYSDKPAMTIDELTGMEFNFGIMPYGPRWRGIRRMFHQYFNQTATPNYREKQTSEIYTFLRRCLDLTGKELDPMNIRLTLASMIVEIVYGFKIQSMDDDYVQAAIEGMDVLSESHIFGRFWVNVIPWLRYVPAWVPGADAVRYGAYWRPKIQNMIDTPFDAILHGTNTNASMAHDLILKLKDEKNPARRADEERNARHATAIAYAAAVDTTYSIIQTFFCAMAMHPEIQNRAREELDVVVGPDRLPTFEDYDALPYIQAIIMECSRWLPVVPLSVPHRVIRDDYYKGYFIPEGTIVLANVWHILRNAQEYPEPERFNPDRFMKDGGINVDIRDPSTVAFGFGRRVCPGRHLAKDHAFLTIASVLHVFDVLPSFNEDGMKHDPTPKMTTGLLSHPDRLHYMLQLRSSDAEKLIRVTSH